MRISASITRVRLALSALRRGIRRRAPTVITRPLGSLPLDSSLPTVVVLVGPGFDQRVPNAATTTRVGWINGFEALGVPTLLLGIDHAEERLPSIPNPLIWTTGFEIFAAPPRLRRFLKRFPVAVGVGPWFTGEAEFYVSHGLEQLGWSPSQRKSILEVEPRFVFTIAPESAFEYFAGWIDAGERVVSLPMALDPKSYPAEPPFVPELVGIEMAFVGGYWPYKARSFDIYLRPYEQRLRVYGYSKWPYSGYSGTLSVDREASLYRQAVLVPVINEPHVSIMGIDINERVFKVLGSGGLAITDASSAYHAHFADDELLIPDSADRYHEMVGEVLLNPARFDGMRRRGQRAVLERHTYRHRGADFLRAIGVEAASDSQHNESRQAPAPWPDSEGRENS